MNDTDSLKGLVEMAILRHDASARQLALKAQADGQKITYTTLSQIRSETYKFTPGPSTLRAIAYLAGVDDSVAFAAAGQQVPGPPLADELPPGADNLSAKSRKVVLEMVRVLVDLEAGIHESQDQSKANPSSKRTLRAVGPSGEVVQGQKNDPEDPEYLKPLPLEQMAAMDNFILARDKFDAAHGADGEENQDPGHDTDGA